MIVRLHLSTTLCLVLAFTFSSLVFLTLTKLSRYIITFDGVFEQSFKVKTHDAMLDVALCCYHLWLDNSETPTPLGLALFASCSVTLLGSFLRFLTNQFGNLFIDFLASFTYTVKEAPVFKPVDLIIDEVKFDTLGAYGTTVFCGKPIRVRLTSAQALTLGLRTVTNTPPSAYVPEMAVSGTRSVPCADQPGVFSFFAGDHQVGMGFRSGNRLITCLHVAKELLSYSEVSLVYKNRAIVLPSLPSPDFYGLDVIAFTMPGPFWSAAGVPALKIARGHKINSVKLYSVDELGNKVVSTGTAQPNDPANPFQYTHTCNSQPGVSGSPLISKDGVIAVHKGSNHGRGKNLAVALDPFFNVENSNESDPGKQYAYRLRSFEEFDSEIKDELEEERRDKRGKISDLRPDVLSKLIWRKRPDSPDLEPRTVIVREGSYTLAKNSAPAYVHKVKPGRNWTDVDEDEDWEPGFNESSKPDVSTSSTPLDFSRETQDTSASPKTENPPLTSKICLISSRPVVSLEAKTSSANTLVSNLRQTSPPPSEHTSASEPSPSDLVTKSNKLESQTSLADSESKRRRKRRSSKQRASSNRNSTSTPSPPAEASAN